MYKTTPVKWERNFFFFLTMNIELIELDGKHFVTVSADGRELKRRGPFLSAVVARAMADQLRELLEIPKDDVDVDAANLPSLISNHEFIVDCARFAEGLVSEHAVRKKYRLDEAVWESLEKDDDERFIITINLGNSEKLTFNKKIAPDPNDIDPNELKTIDHAPREMLPIIAAANKRGEGNGGEPL